MEKQKQVCSPEPSKRLRELGVPQESYFWWVNGHGHMELHDRRTDEDSIAAFTVAELADWQKDIDEPEPWSANGSWWWYRGEEQVEADTQANAYAARGIYLIENGLLDVKTLNV